VFVVGAFAATTFVHVVPSGLVQIPSTGCTATTRFVELRERDAGRSS
jgi:hypothetical protein